MKTIHKSEILIAPDRQRQEFNSEALQELATSISVHGLFHAPIFRSIGGSYYLVAGERRIKAMETLWMMGKTIRYNGEDLPEDHLPMVTLGDLTPLEAEEAELEENTKRANLTWQEQAAAHQRLHLLRVGQAAAISEVHTIADTAREIFDLPKATPAGKMGDYQARTRQEIMVAAHLSDPDVAKAKNVKEAVKILERKEEVIKNVALAKEVGKTFNANKHNHLNTNCISWMFEQITKGNIELFDCILTDPPYGMNAQDFGDAAGKLLTIDHTYDDSKESWRDLMNKFVPMAFHLAKPQAHMYLFCDIEGFFELKKTCESAGWYVFRTPLTVYKLNSGRVPLPEQGPRRQSEWILYAIKGKKPVTAIYSDVIPCNGDDNLGHGAQKPVELYENLLKRSVRAGDRVFDGFAGSGTIFAAAHKLQVEATGIELNEGYYAIGVKRLQMLDVPTAGRGEAESDGAAEALLDQLKGL